MTADELALLSDAQLAVAQHRPGDALSALAAHERQFPNSAYMEERASLRIEALVETGRVSDAKTALDQLLSTHPHSAYRARLVHLLDVASGSAVHH